MKPVKGERRSTEFAADPAEDSESNTDFPDDIAYAASTQRLERLIAVAVAVADLPACDVFSLRDWVEGYTPRLAESLGLLLVAQFLALAEGSLAVELSSASLTIRLVDLVDREDLPNWIDQALGDLDAEAFSAIIAPVPRDATPAHTPILLSTGAGRRHLYFQKFYRAERDFYRRMKQRLSHGGPIPELASMRAALDAVLREHPLRAAGKPIAWDDDQRTALGLALLKNLVIISGGPGTGKTSIVLNVLRTLVRTGVSVERIALAAPTGRAAQRLTDSLRSGLERIAAPCPGADRSLGQLNATTLHQLLDYLPSRNLFRRHEENPISADVVIVDEVSMVSIDQMASLVRALGPETKLILLGDKDQLPSVDAGAVLGQLVGDLDAACCSPTITAALKDLGLDLDVLPADREHWLRDAVVFLRTNHRSQAAIRDAARAINARDTTLVEKLPQLPDVTADNLTDTWRDAADRGGCWWWEQKFANVAELQHQLHRWMDDTFLAPRDDGVSLRDLAGFTDWIEQELDDPDTQAWLGRLFAAFETSRLLTLVREGPWGCDSINRVLAAWLRRRTPIAAGRGDFFAGAPILITRNDRSRQLFNGDVGLTVVNRRREPQVLFSRHDGYLSLPPESLPTHEPGFALTVHKSQGSEFARALIVLPPQGGRRLLTKELLYTAVTRAKHWAILSGTAEALRHAIGRRIQRESGLS